MVPLSPVWPPASMCDEVLRNAQVLLWISFLQRQQWWLSDSCQFSRPPILKIYTGGRCVATPVFLGVEDGGNLRWPSSFLGQFHCGAFLSNLSLMSCIWWLLQVFVSCWTGQLKLIHSFFFFFLFFSLLSFLFLSLTPSLSSLFLCLCLSFCPSLSLSVCLSRLSLGQNVVSVTWEM